MNRHMTSSVRNMELLTARTRPLNLTPPGRMLRSTRSKSLSRELSRNSSWPTCPADLGTMTRNTRPMYAHIQPKIFSDWEVPKTVMSGTTADITQICMLGWYEWVKFHSTSVSFPEDWLVLRWFLGPSIDVGLAMTAKILIAASDVVHHSMSRSLTPKELAYPFSKIVWKPTYKWQRTSNDCTWQEDNLMRALLIPQIRNLT